MFSAFSLQCLRKAHLCAWYNLSRGESQVLTYRRQNTELLFIANFQGDRPQSKQRTEGGLRMGRRVRVTAIAKEEPDIRLYVLALIALARQLQEEEERQGAERKNSAGGEEARDDRS